MKYSPYSVSRIETYNQCPKKFHYQYISKLYLASENLALYRGSYIHEIIENDYNYDIPVKINDIFTIKEVEKTKEVVRKFEASPLGIRYKKISHMSKLSPKHEEKFGFKIENGLTLTTYEDPEAWIRGALDFQFKTDDIIYNIDWKSGKDKSKDETFGINQSMAYSIYLMYKFPNVNKFVSKFVFVEHGTEKEIIYVRDKLANYIKHFYNMTKTIEKDLIYDGKVSALCDYCEFYTQGYCKTPEQKENELNNFMSKPVW